MCSMLFKEFVLDARTGLNPRKNFKLGNGNNYYITIKDIIDGKIKISEKTERIDDDAIRLISKRSRIKKGDVLFTSIGRIGQTAIVEETPNNWNINESVFCFTLDLTKVDRDYFCWLFASPKWRCFLEKASTGSTFHSIKMGRLNNTRFSIPALDIQAFQSNHLKAIKKQIDACKSQVALLDEHIKSLFNEMFGQPEINEKGYPMVSLGNLAKSINYGTSKPAIKDGKTPYLRMGNMTDDGRIDLSDLKYITLDGSEYEKAIVRDGDFLFNRTNSREHVGRSVAFHEKQEMVIAGYIIRVRLDKSKVEADYLSAFMNSLYMKKELFNMAKGAVNQANINAKEMAAIKLFLPPLDLQVAFVEKKKQIDKLRFKYQRQIELLNELMEKKMEEYFGGDENA